MDLPTYTNIWRIEKRLYKLYDLRLPMPLPIVWIGVFVGVFVPWSLLLVLVGVPVEMPWHVLYLVPPGIVTWLSTRPVIEGKRLTELLESQLRYLGQPKAWYRLAPTSESETITFSGRVWRTTPARAKSKAPRKARQPQRRREGQRISGPRQVRPAVAAAAAAASQAPVAEPTTGRWGTRRGTAPALKARVRETAPPSAPRAGVGALRREEALPGGPGRRQDALPPAVHEGSEPSAREHPEWGEAAAPLADVGAQEPAAGTRGREAAAGGQEVVGRAGDVQGLGHGSPEDARADREAAGPARETEGHKPAAGKPIDTEALRRLRRLAASADAPAESSGRPEGERQEPEKERREDEVARDQHRKGQPPRLGTAPVLSGPQRVWPPLNPDAKPLPRPSTTRPATHTADAAPIRQGETPNTPDVPSSSAGAPDSPDRSPRPSAEVAGARSGMDAAGATGDVPKDDVPETVGDAVEARDDADAPQSVGEAADAPDGVDAPGTVHGGPRGRTLQLVGEDAGDAEGRDGVDAPGDVEAPVATHDEPVHDEPVHDEPERGVSQRAADAPGNAEVLGTEDAPGGADAQEPGAVGDRPERVTARRPAAKGDAPVTPLPGTRGDRVAPLSGTRGGQGAAVPDARGPAAGDRRVAAASADGPQSTAAGADGSQSTAAGAGEGRGAVHERGGDFVAPVPVPRPGEGRVRRVESVVGRDSGGWRRIAQVVVGGGGVRTDGSEIDEARARGVFGGSRRIVVLGCTGGAGQSTTALMLGHTFARYRDDRVVAVDANTGGGTLTSKIQPETPETLTSLLSGLDRVSGYLTMRGYTTRTASGLEVISADTDAGAEQRLADRSFFSDHRLGESMRLLDRHYKLAVIDPAAALAARLLPYADQLVLVVPASEEASEAVAMTYEWLDGHGCAELRRRAVMVVNGVSRRSMADVEQAESVARGRCRAIVRVPWEDGLAPEGVEVVDPGQLRTAGKRAYLALAGVVIAGFAAQAQTVRPSEEEWASDPPGTRIGER
ncbi:TcpE family conjugal transfer membrane protein [Nonomuraea sp. NPDC050153]|uniref:TcpE family conjugal transfer membrane protein n=1 Tax=Nonomuraea sp. NPDC050153 TaxID=3364359 RepID=UPI0037B91AD4